MRLFIVFQSRSLVTGIDIHIALLISEALFCLTNLNFWQPYMSLRIYNVYIGNISPAILIVV